MERSDENQHDYRALSSKILQSCDPAPISPSIIGSDVAEKVLDDLYAGQIAISDVVRWVAELHAEKLSELARAVESKIPLLS